MDIKKIIQENDILRKFELCAYIIKATFKNSADMGYFNSNSLYKLFSKIFIQEYYTNVEDFFINICEPISNYLLDQYNNSGSIDFINDLFEIKNISLIVDDINLKYPEITPNLVISLDFNLLEIIYKYFYNKKVDALPNSKIKAAILGSAIGDGLGVPVEFYSREVIAENPVVSMLEYGSHHQPKGTWSDDTSMHLCLIDSLCSGLDYQDIAQKWLAWMEHGLWAATGKSFGIGDSIRVSLLKFKRGDDLFLCGGETERDNGNGSLMRTLPLAFYVKNMSIKKRKDIVFAVSAITHSHIRSQLACWFYVEIVINLINGMGKDAAIDQAYQLISSFNIQDSEYFKQCNSSIKNLHRDEIKSTGYVINSLEASLWSFLTTENYRDAVLTAVNLGNDTDTIGAITGGLAGVYYGLDQFPVEWLNVLQRKDDITALCEDFSKNI